MCLGCINQQAEILVKDIKPINLRQYKQTSLDSSSAQQTELCVSVSECDTLKKGQIGVQLQPSCL